MNKAAETAKIPCAVCRDLMPLVQDGVASPESEALVQAHMAVCPACRALWQGTDDPAMPEQSAPMTEKSSKDCAAVTVCTCFCWPLRALLRASPWGIQAVPTG